MTPYQRGLARTNPEAARRDYAKTAARRYARQAEQQKRGRPSLAAPRKTRRPTQLRFYSPRYTRAIVELVYFATGRLHSIGWVTDRVMASALAILTCVYDCRAHHACYEHLKDRIKDRTGLDVSNGTVANALRALTMAGLLEKYDTPKPKFLGYDARGRKRFSKNPVRQLVPGPVVTTALLDARQAEETADRGLDGGYHPGSPTFGRGDQQLGTGTRTRARRTRSSDYDPANPRVPRTHDAARPLGASICGALQGSARTRYLSTESSTPHKAAGSDGPPPDGGGENGASPSPWDLHNDRIRSQRKRDPQGSLYDNDGDDAPLTPRQVRQLTRCDDCGQFQWECRCGRGGVSS